MQPPTHPPAWLMTYFEQKVCFVALFYKDEVSTLYMSMVTLFALICPEESESN